MNKYIPKVGDTVINETYGDKRIVIALGNAKAFLRREDGHECSAYFSDCKPIQTKADDELYNLVLIIEDCYESGISATAKEIQKAGFTIPKKIKRSEISMIISRNSNYCKNPMFPSMLSGICELLGDLVEQDIGGAE
jgi:hypothetical protein